MLLSCGKYFSIYQMTKSGSLLRGLL